MTKKTKKLVSNFFTAAAIILIWRGIWYLLDYIDLYIFEGNPMWTVIGGMIAGILILYVPDKNLNELGKL